MRYYLSNADVEMKVDLLERNDLSLDNSIFICSYSVKEKILFKKIQVKRLAGKLFTSLDGVTWTRQINSKIQKIVISDQEFNIEKGFRKRSNQEEVGGGLYTKMPGKVVKILVKVGDLVEKGQTLLVLEAMKMENEIKSNVNSRIKNIFIAEGQTLTTNVLLISMDEN